MDVSTAKKDATHKMLIKILGGDPRPQNVSAMVYKDGISNVMDNAFALS